jgi:hypothetical protein
MAADDYSGKIHPLIAAPRVLANTRVTATAAPHAKALGHLRDVDRSSHSKDPTTFTVMEQYHKHPRSVGVALVLAMAALFTLVLSLSRNGGERGIRNAGLAL